jgi:hypothetical protein
MKKIILMIIIVLGLFIIASQTASADSVQEDFSNTTITVNQTVEFSAKVNPASNIKWYCGDVLEKSEFASSSNYTFIPKATGTYWIALTVNGATNPIGPTKVRVIAESTSNPTPTQMQTPTQSQNPTPTQEVTQSGAIALATVLAGSMAAIIVGLLAYFKRRKRHD